MNMFLNLLPLLVGLFFVTVILLTARLQARGKPLPPVRAQPPRPQIRASEAALKAFRRRFAQRRWIRRLITYPILAVGMLVLYLGVKGHRDNALFALLGPFWMQFGFGAALTAVLAQKIGGIFLMRCPACGKRLALGSRYETSQCPHCQLQLS